MSRPVSPESREIVFEKVSAPFTETQVQALNNWQRWGILIHRCPHHGYPKQLTASASGFSCAVPGCSYQQDWAYAMAFKAKYCTKDAPYTGDVATTKDLVIHVGAENTCPDYEGEILQFRCPHCQLVYDVDCRW
jgi:hypothetical protein